MMTILKPTESIASAMNTAKQTRAFSTPGKARAATQRKAVRATQKTPSTSRQKPMTWDERRLQIERQKERKEQWESLKKNGKEFLGGIGKGLKATADAADDLTR